MTQEQTHHIWVVGEHGEGRVRPVTYEVVAFAHKVADALRSKVSVVVVGNPIQPLAQEIAGETGCDVAGIDSPSALQYDAEVYRGLLKTVYDQDMPTFIFMAHTSTGLDLAPALAVDIGGSCLTGVFDCTWEEGPIFIRQICNGKILEDVRPLPGRPVVVTVMPGAVRVHPRKIEKPGAVRLYEMPPPPGRTRSIRYIEATPSSVDLRDAEVIVAAGRGVGGPEHLAMIRDLAGLFKRSAVGASRPLCDMGWIPLECQVGMTGQTISPKLYIACGISGAVQHTMGMKNSGLIVAINKDRNALFCKVAHYCIPADMHAFIPVLIEKLQQHLHTSGHSRG